MDIPEKMIDFAPAAVVYNIGRPGMPRKAVLPTAAPVHDGATTELKALAVVVVTRKLTLRVDPSFSAKEKFCPPAERAVASL